MYNLLAFYRSLHLSLSLCCSFFLTFILYLFVYLFFLSFFPSFHLLSNSITIFYSMIYFLTIRLFEAITIDIKNTQANERRKKTIQNMRVIRRIWSKIVSQFNCLLVYSATFFSLCFFFFFSSSSHLCKCGSHSI